MSNSVKPYTWCGETYEVDAALDHDILDRLNRLAFTSVYSVCAGHERGENGHDIAQRALVILDADPVQHKHSLIGLAPYLERLSSTEYAAVVERYRGNGGRLKWCMTVVRDERGQAPRSWWTGLLDALEG